MNHRFDIVLPTIGRDSLLAATESVQKQTYQNWRLITVQDTENRGDYGAWARNTAITIGENEWIAYIDDDDIWLPHHLETLSRLLVEAPYATMLRTAGQAFSWKHKSPRSSKLMRKLGQINSTDFMTVGMAHTRELFEKTQGWQPCDNHDKLLWEEMLSLGGIPIATDSITYQFQR